MHMCITIATVGLGTPRATMKLYVGMQNILLVKIFIHKFDKRAFCPLQYATTTTNQYIIELIEIQTYVLSSKTVNSQRHTSMHVKID